MTDIYPDLKKYHKKYQTNISFCFDRPRPATSARPHTSVSSLKQLLSLLFSVEELMTLTTSKAKTATQ